MRRSAVALITFLSLGTGLMGCSGTMYHRDTPRGTLIEVTPSSKQPVFKIAVALTHAPSTPFGRQLGDFYLRSLTDAVLEENSRLQLITPHASDYPPFLHLFSQQPTPSGQMQNLLERIRMEGFQALMTAGVLDIHADAKRTGIFWFRKMRYFLSFDIVLDVYDPFTAAKMVSRVREETIKIDLDDYESYQNGTLTGSEAVNEAVSEAAEDLAEQVAEAFKNDPWKTCVKAVQDGRIFLAASPRNGLGMGDQLFVYEGRRVIEGKENEKFIVPGYEIGQVRITGVDGQMAEATAEGKLEIEVGDIAVYKN